MKNREVIISTTLTVISLLIAFAGGYLFNQFINPPELELPLLSQAQSIVKNHAFYPLPEARELEYGMIRGMVSALEDPYASFVEPVQHELDSDAFEGEFGGIGAQIAVTEENQFVLFPFPESPAEEAGIQEGDILLAVDQIKITVELDIHTVVSMIRGPQGKKVTLVLTRPPEMENYEVEIIRENFPLPSVLWRQLEQDQSIGLIQVNLIADSTAEEISNAIEDLKSSGVQKFILDLQDNGGGLLEAGIEIARLFLEDGDLMYQQARGEKIETYRVNKPGEYTEIPLVVLINSFSASASEIIAGGLQTHDRAVLIGTPSFGKNTIQLVFTLENDSSIHITNAIWWLPGGSPDEEFQLSPDILTESENPSRDEILQLAVDYFQNP
jgi:carboxyl-terminal processing protease